MGLSAIGLAAIVSAASAAAGTAYSVKRGRTQKDETAYAKKKEEALKKEKERLSKLKETKSPGQRLLGGRPTLG